MNILKGMCIINHRLEKVFHYEEKEIWFRGKDIAKAS